MTLVIPNVGEAAMQDNSLKATTPEALILKLYSNNYDAVNSSVAGSFTEVTGGGYASKTLTRAGWNAAVPGSPTSSTYGTAQVFSFTGTIAAVVGYFLVGATSGTLYWAERLYAGAGQAFGNGDSLTVTPKITYASVSND
jgi:hypothetical protein